MSVTDRASQVQKCTGCPRCLSWNHARDACKMPANSCNKDLGNGVKCKGDHSKLLCGSGNPYCAAVSVRRSCPVAIKRNESCPVAKYKRNESCPVATPRVGHVDKAAEAGEGDFSCVDESAETVYFLQDIPVNGCEETARTFLIKGSNRVFIRKEFGEDMNLKKKEVSFFHGDCHP